MNVARSISDLISFGPCSAINHSTGKGERVSQSDGIRFRCPLFPVFLFPEHHSCEYGSFKYYLYCGISGMLSCGVTHTAVVPLVSDLRMEIRLSSIG